MIKWIDNFKTWLAFKLIASRHKEEFLNEEYTRKKYHELIMEVGNKHSGETRHETALRYIRQAENNTKIDSAKVDIASIKKINLEMNKWGNM